MQKIFMLLLLMSMQLPAMHAARSFIRQKPLTTMIATAATASGLTYAHIHSDRWKNPLHEFKVRQVRKAIAQEQAQRYEPEFKR